MTILALSLFVLACGWKFIKDWRFTRYAALKNSGHPQYFGAAIAAVYLGCMSASLHNFFSDFDSYREAVSSGLTYLPSLAESKVERASVATTTSPRF